MYRHCARLVRAGVGVRVAGAGLASIVSYQALPDLAKPDSSLQLQNMGEEFSHKFLLQQSSALNVESASVTLTQTVMAIQTCSRSYCMHITSLASLLTMGSDGLPLAYTNEEIYDKVVELRAVLRKEKATLIELGVLFAYIRKLMDSVAETAFLVGAEYASLQAASRLASAEMQVKEDLGMAERAEQELLVVEKENVEKVGKQENKVTKLDTDLVKEEIKKFDGKESVGILDEEVVKVTVIESETVDDTKGSVDEEPFSFDRNSDEQIKISVRENDLDDTIKISVKDENKDEIEISLNDPEPEPEIPRYKMPTF